MVHRLKGLETGLSGFLACAKNGGRRSVGDWCESIGQDDDFNDARFGSISGATQYLTTELSGRSGKRVEVSSEAAVVEVDYLVAVRNSSAVPDERLSIFDGIEKIGGVIELFAQCCAGKV
jgi:hypothetical protein